MKIVFLILLWVTLATVAIGLKVLTWRSASFITRRAAPPDSNSGRQLCKRWQIVISGALIGFFLVFAPVYFAFPNLRLEYQIALAMFPNEEGLFKEGDNTFSLSANSGLASVQPATVGARGFVVGGSLEQSNVDITTEFTNMIVTERGFQANSRVVTTSDEMLTEVLNLKR